MKNILINITGIALMGILLPLVWVANKIADLKSTEPPKPFYPKEPSIRGTAYPDDYDRTSAKEFNEWGQYIHDQLN